MLFSRLKRGRERGGVWAVICSNTHHLSWLLKLFPFSEGQLLSFPIKSFQRLEMSWKHTSNSYYYNWQSGSSGSQYGQPHQGSDPNTVYVKGSCKNNGREGAQGGIGTCWGPNHKLNTSSTYSGRQTNQSASLEAATKGIEQAKAQNKNKVTVYTDNQLITKGMNEWIDNWKANGWKTSKNKDVVHKEQFANLDSMTRGMNVEWKYIPAGSKVEGNTEARRLAKDATRKK